MQYMFMHFIFLITMFALYNDIIGVLVLATMHYMFIHFIFLITFGLSVMWSLIL